VANIPATLQQLNELSDLQQTDCAVSVWQDIFKVSEI